MTVKGTVTLGEPSITSDFDLLINGPLSDLMVDVNIIFTTYHKKIQI